jgi:dimethylargininase
MVRVAIMREPSRTYEHACEGVTFAKSIRQHQRLRGIYRRHGWKVEMLPNSWKYMAGTFTQDTAFVSGDEALLTNCMSPWRLKEPRHRSHLEKALSKYLLVVGQMGLPAELDVGEVVKTDDEYIVGCGKKAAYAGVRQIRQKLDLDLPIRTAKRREDAMPHLGSGLSYLGNDWLLASEFLAGYPFLEDYHVLWAPMEEENGANVVSLGDGSVIASADSPITNQGLRELGLDVETVDLSEYNKGNGHISCLSINIVL